MYPVICKLGPFTIYAYGLMLALAFTISLTLAISQAKREKINPDIIFNFSFLVFISGIVGARIFYVAANLGYYLKNPLEMIMLNHGGLAWFGGLILSNIAGIAYLKKQKLPVCRTLDLFAPFIALAQAIGRIGCFLNGCCFGRESPFGIYFNLHSAALIPTQIYSSLALIFIFFILRFLQERPHREGEIFFTYLLFYSLKRFFMEFWRADSPSVLSGLTLFHVLSLVLFCVSVLALALIKKAKK